MDIIYRSELRYLGILCMCVCVCITETLNWNVQVRSLSPKLSKVCYIIESKLKDIMSPHMITIYYANFHAFLRCTIMFWGGDIESNNIFKLQEGVMWIISGVSKRVSCRHIWGIQYTTSNLFIRTWNSMLCEKVQRICRAKCTNS